MILALAITAVMVAGLAVIVWGAWMYERQGGQGIPRKEQGR